MLTFTYTLRGLVPDDADLAEMTARAADLFPGCRAVATSDGRDIRLSVDTDEATRDDERLADLLKMQVRDCIVVVMLRRHPDLSRVAQLSDYAMFTEYSGWDEPRILQAVRPVEGRESRRGPGVAAESRLRAEGEADPPWRYCPWCGKGRGEISEGVACCEDAHRRVSRAFGDWHGP